MWLDHVSKIKFKLFSIIIKYEPDKNHQNNIYNCIKRDNVLYIYNRVFAAFGLTGQFYLWIPSLKYLQVAKPDYLMLYSSLLSFFVVSKNVFWNIKWIVIYYSPVILFSCMFFLLFISGSSKRMLCVDWPGPPGLPKKTCWGYLYLPITVVIQRLFKIVITQHLEHL